MIYLASDLQAAETLYPTCFGADVDPSKVFVAVLGNQGPDPLNGASGVRATMGLAMWVSFVLHVVGVEYYVRAFLCLFLIRPANPFGAHSSSRRNQRTQLDMDIFLNLMTPLTRRHLGSIRTGKVKKRIAVLTYLFTMHGLFLLSVLFFFIYFIVQSMSTTVLLANVQLYITNTAIVI
jgi:hypothetical protein